MVIEWLKVKVPAEKRELYIQKDHEIWTSALSAYQGFLGKEVWINPEDPTEIILVIRWSSKEAWKAVPQDVLQKAERRFNEAVGQAFGFTETGAYQVRKFLQP